MIVNVITPAGFGQASVLWMPLSLAVVAALVFGYLANERSATVTTPDYIETRTLLKTRRTAWHDVQEFEIKGNPRFGQRAFVRTATDSVLRLPHLDTTNVKSISNRQFSALGLQQATRGSSRANGRHGCDPSSDRAVMSQRVWRAFHSPRRITAWSSCTSTTV